MLNIGLKTALQDSDFRKSDFFPSNPPLMGDEDSKKFILEVFQVHQQYKKLLYGRVFKVGETCEKIFSYASASQLAKYSLVNKEWNDRVEKFMDHMWKAIKNHHTMLLQEMSQIEKLVDRTSTKFSKLSKHISPSTQNNVSLKDTPITVENVKKITYDNALRIIWKERLRGKLIELQVEKPEANASAQDVRAFLKECGALKQIEKLDVSDSELAVIPPELGLLEGLTQLMMGQNRIEKIENLGNLLNLIELDLHNNRIGKIDNLGNPSNLTKLDLRNNRIGEIKNLGNLSNLTELYLSDNSIGEIKNLGNLSNLTELYLSDNSIGEIKNLDKLTRLASLDLSKNKIRKVERLDKLSALTKLSLSFSDTPFGVVEELNCPALKELDMQFNPAIFVIRKLNCPLLTNLMLTDTAIHEIGDLNCPALIEFRVSCYPTPMLISNDSLQILKKSSNDGWIDHFEKQKSYKCRSPLAKLYQGIITEIPKDKLKEIFNSLKPKDKQLILEIVTSESEQSTYGSCQSSAMMSLQMIEQTKSFKWRHFRSAVRTAIVKKYIDLSIEEQDKVLIKRDQIKLLEYGEDEDTYVGILANIPLLADALEECGY